MSRSERPATAWRVLIRKAEPRDSGALDRLVSAFAAELGLADRKRSSSADFATALSASPPFLHVLLAEHAGEAVGLCIWFPWFSTWRGTAGVYVQDLYVAPAMRAAGLARRLIATAAREMRPPGAAFVRLAVDMDNAAALGFYAGLGFERVEGEHVLDLSGDAFKRLVAPDPTPGPTPDLTPGPNPDTHTDGTDAP